MSNLEKFLKEVISPIVSEIEFTEDNIFYDEIMLSIDEILAMIDAPDDEKEGNVWD